MGVTLWENLFITPELNGFGETCMISVLDHFIVCFRERSDETELDCDNEIDLFFFLIKSNKCIHVICIDNLYSIQSERLVEGNARSFNFLLGIR